MINENRGKSILNLSYDRVLTKRSIANHMGNLLTYDLSTLSTISVVMIGHKTALAQWM